MKNVTEITKEIKGSEWQKYLDKAFEKNKKNIKIDGFRKGSVPKEVYLKKAGIESLFMDAYEIAMDETYRDTIIESKVQIVVEPTISIEKITKDELVVKYTLISKPEVKLGKYKGLGIKREEIKVTNEEIDHEIDHIRSHMADVITKENGVVEKGDTAVIDFEGKVDGKVIDGGTGKNYSLEIGSNTFIPGFEDGVEGMKKGETKILKLKFPHDYIEDLKDKDVEFAVTVNEIKTRKLPELDEEFFKDLGEDDIKTEAEFKKSVKENLEKAKKEQADSKFIDEIVGKAIETMKVDINPEIIDYEVSIMMHNYAHELSHQGITMNQYFQITGMDEEKFKESLKPQAEKRLKTRYLLEEIINLEKIEATDEEAKKEVAEEAKQYGIKEEELLHEIGGLEAMKFELQARKAVEFLKENN